MGRSTPVLITVVAGAVILVAGGILLLWRSGSPASRAGRVLGEEQKAYLQQIVVSDARMSAAENFLGDRVVYLNARITNKGTKTIRGLDLDLKFVDLLNQVVLQETVHPVRERGIPLRPGETRSFRATFEHMPADWNQAPPRIAAVGVEFETGN